MDLTVADFGQGGGVTLAGGGFTPPTLPPSNPLTPPILPGGSRNLRPNNTSPTAPQIPVHGE
jgi:hypothetical protein